MDTSTEPSSVFRIENAGALSTKIVESPDSLVYKDSARYILIRGDAKTVLDLLPVESVNCVITSPPYWKQRDYDVDETYKRFLLGNEASPEEYVNNLADVFRKVKKVLKKDGSIWLNIGDKYVDKNLMGMPWRVALRMMDDGWILRNDIIWYSMKGTQSAKDRFRDVYEHIFHFVKSKNYYFDREAVLTKPSKQPYYANGKITSATGVSGERYRNQIIDSQFLKKEERRKALEALDDTLKEMERGEIVDFRMTIRGQQRTLHSDNGNVSGRAKELQRRGFYIIKSHSNGFMPSDIWSIVPEDEIRDSEHYSAFPVELLTYPIESTSKRDTGVVLDPFAGTGTTVLAAVSRGRKGIGVDISTNYLKIAEDRLRGAQIKL